MCSLNFNLLSIIIPKYLIVTCSSILLFKYIFIAFGSFLFLLDTSMTLDFSSLNIILFLFAQAVILLSSPMFGPKREEVTGYWRRLHKEQLHGLC